MHTTESDTNCYFKKKKSWSASTKILVEKFVSGWFFECLAWLNAKFTYGMSIVQNIYEILFIFIFVFKEKYYLT